MKEQGRNWLSFGLIQSTSTIPSQAIAGDLRSRYSGSQKFLEDTSIR
jgi:hypothetical protein